MTTDCGLRFKDKVCLITGGSCGIGEGCVRVFVKNGAKVVFCALGADAGTDLAADVNQKGPGEAMYVQCDLTKEEEIKGLIEETVSRYGCIDCLINNAGFHPPYRSIDDTTADMFRDLLNLNVLGYFLVSKYALPHIRKRRGCVINNSSMVGHIGQPNAIPYVATKGAVSAMTRAMAIDEAAHGVRVNAFSPSNVWTPMWNTLATDSLNKPLAIKDGNESQLLGRMGTIEEAGELCLYLASEGTFLTGVDVPFSGGAELNYGKKTRMAQGDNSTAPK